MATSHSAVALAASVGAITDGNIIRVDLGSRILTSAEFNIILKTVTDASVSPGTSKTVTVNRYWSDEELPATAATLTQLAHRKTAATASALTNTVSTTQYFEAVSAIRSRARYLYLSVDVTTTLGGPVAMTIELRRVPGVDRD